LSRHGALYNTERGLTINPKIEHIYGALVHELAHFLDNALSGYGDDFASELAEQKFNYSKNFPAATRGAQTLAGWWAVTEASAGVRDLHEKLASRTLSKDERRIAKYLANPSELFARSFCRWAAERTHDGELVAMANASKYVRVRWSDRGFAPIAAEFDTLFAADGAGIATLNWCAERRRVLASSRRSPNSSGCLTGPPDYDS
jgi:phosphopantetheinyl transferase (holo-ACP synthase)